MTNLKNQITIALNKHLVIPVYVLALLGLLGWFRGCSSASESQKTKKQVEALTSEVDSLKRITPTIEQIKTEFEIEGFRISKRTLYDQNAIVRTTIRPDDRMNEYDQEIEKLRNKK